MPETTFTYVTPEPMESSLDGTDFKILKDSILDHKKWLEEIYQALLAMLADIENFRSFTNRCRIGATVTGILSTILTVIGVGLAPMTFGASLSLSGVGIATAVGAAAMSSGVAIGDWRTNKKTNQRIKEICDKLQTNEEEIDEYLLKMNDKVENLMGSGVEYEEAIAMTVFGIMKGTVEGGRVLKGAGGVALPLVATFTEGASKLVANSAQVGGNVAKTFGSSAIHVTSATTKIVLPIAVGVVGVLLNIADVYLLWRAFNTDHPSAATVKNLMTIIKEKIANCMIQIQQMENYLLRQCIEYNEKVTYQREKELERIYESLLDESTINYDKKLKKMDEDHQAEVKDLQNRVSELEEIVQNLLKCVSDK